MAVRERTGSGVEAWEMPVQTEGRQRLQQTIEEQAEAPAGQVKWAALVEGAGFVWVGAVEVAVAAALATRTGAAWVMSSEASWDLAVSGVGLMDRHTALLHDKKLVKS